MRRALLLCALLALPAAAVAEPAIIGPATVIDGDTIIIAGRHIRLSGIDAPELKQTCELDGQLWAAGVDARLMLARIVGKDPIACDPQGRDRYGRTIAQCWVTIGGEPFDLGRLMVQSGRAWAFRRYSLAYVTDEGSGPLARSTCQPAWDWRAQHRNR